MYQATEGTSVNPKVRNAQRFFYDNAIKLKMNLKRSLTSGDETVHYKQSHERGNYKEKLRNAENCMASKKHGIPNLVAPS